jgi:hypothetical protein
MTCPGDSDVITGGAGEMGPCPPPQHQPPDGVCKLIILCIYNVYIKDIQCISQKYTIHIPGIYIVYTKNIQYILGIYNVYTKENHVVYTMNILGI